MENLLSPSIFYLFIIVYVVYTFKHNGFKIIYNNFEPLKYSIGTAAYFFINVNVLFFCSYCNHCHNACIPFTMLAVLIGTAVYLLHLFKQTQTAIRQIIAGEKFDLMAPFFSIPYFYMTYQIFYATFSSGMESLHTLESKMMIVMLYPFFIAMGELTDRIKRSKVDSDNKEIK